MGSLSNLSEHRWPAYQTDHSQFNSPIVARLLSQLVPVFVVTNPLQMFRDRGDLIPHSREVAHHQIRR
ncbi:hypothetical protein [Burkholderia cenocepacia]|uniref:hypothetical protein n=1 Tax=Burkholderia cenocepacia TaxID=95486 RepID=UPI0029391982|nr:hypothetical protein [Burkholderia cenocepacia]MDV3102924.1 hypothetical protein [Burkholderia cenocepacia]